jgi:hypothetical protein
VVALSMVLSEQTAANRDEVAMDLAHFASLTQSYYRRTKASGGGGGSFEGMTMQTITGKPVNINGSYILDPDPVTGSPASVTLIGTGTEIGTNGIDRVKEVMLVYPDSMTVDVAQGN